MSTQAVADPEPLATRERWLGSTSAFAARSGLTVVLIWLGAVGAFLSRLFAAVLGSRRLQAV